MHAYRGKRSKGEKEKWMEVKLGRNRKGKEGEIDIGNGGEVGIGDIS
jgi:hypothetical protein